LNLDVTTKWATSQKQIDRSFTNWNVNNECIDCVHTFWSISQRFTKCDKHNDQSNDI
jgi:hypothetical protein